MMDFLFLLLGLSALIAGGEFLVKGSVGIAKKLGLSTLVIGLTVVAFGTSTPELIVSLKAALSNNPEIAVGNVIGSNIANIALVLGITSLIFPILVDRNSIRYDWPVAFISSIMLWLFISDFVLTFWEGIILMSSLCTYVYFLLWENLRSNKNQDPEIKDSGATHNEVFFRSIFFLIVGLIGLYYGSEWFLEGAVGIAERAGLSKHVIGVTVVAFGTSAPELFTSIIAAFRKESNIAVGNLLGSNIFNIFMVLGVTSTVKPIPIEQAILSMDIFWVLGIILILLPFMITGRKIGRIKGAVLLLSYVFYTFILLSK